MRTWIYNRVKAILDAHGWTYKILSSGAADTPAVKPFLIITMEVEQPPLDLPAGSGAAWVPWAIWVHDTPGSMLKIDDVVIALKNELPTLDGVVIGGLSRYGLDWTETGQDSYDDHFGTNTRPVRFRAMTRR